MTTPTDPQLRAMSALEININETFFAQVLGVCEAAATLGALLEADLEAAPLSMRTSNALADLKARLEGMSDIEAQIEAQIEASSVAQVTMQICAEGLLGAFHQHVVETAQADPDLLRGVGGCFPAWDLGLVLHVVPIGSLANQVSTLDPNVHGLVGDVALSLLHASGAPEDLAGAKISVEESLSALMAWLERRLHEVFAAPASAHAAPAEA